MSTYSAALQDVRSLCFSAPLNVLFYENRSKSRSTILQLDCSKSPPMLKNNAQQINTFTIVNEMCCVQHGNEHYLVTAQRHKNSGVCVYNTQTAELKFSLKTFRPNAIPAVAIDGAGNILVCDSHYEEIYKVSAAGEELGSVLKNREKLFDLIKMQWCSRSSNLALVYKNFAEQWCVTAYSMDSQ